MNAAEYNANQYSADELTDNMLVELVEFWQRKHSLAVDGYAGPNTLASIQNEVGDLEKFYPLRLLSDGRQAVLTSGFHTENPSRPTHKGADFFLPWEDGDPEVPIGDGGAVAKNGVRRWWIPEGTHAVSAASGIIQKAGPTKTGYRVWVDHKNGERTGYFHLENCLVEVGQSVQAGFALGLVSDNPTGHDGKHLHFEVSPSDRYAPKNPRLWLKGATYLDA